MTDNTYTFWNRYYYRYLRSFAAFMVPEASAGSYRVISDELGRVADVQSFLASLSATLEPDGRILVTQYSALWEPALRLASRLGARKGVIEQNWLSLKDIENFAYLAGLETVRAGTKMICPVYIPGVSWFLNAVVANVWPFTRLGLFHYAILRKPEPRTKTAPGQVNVGLSLSIIVPARNEAGTIERIVRELPQLGAFTELVFVEGHSSDATFDEIKRVAAQESAKGASGRKILYAVQDGRGKGDAVRKGFDMATGDILAIYDADMTVPPEEVTKFYDAIVSNKADFVNGSRLVYPLERDSMRVLNFFGNKFFSLAFSWILGQPMKDTLCGTKVLWRKDYDKIKAGRAFFGDFDPFGDFDLLFGASKLNLKIVDMPVHYKERVYGATNISRFSHGWLLLKMTFFAAGKLKFRA